MAQYTATGAANLLLEREIIWVCPNCPTTARTTRADVHTQMHPCAALGGFITPMVERGTQAKVEAVERADFVGSEQVQWAEIKGKRTPVMSVVTTRDDGEDCTVYAPVATATHD